MPTDQDEPNSTRSPVSIMARAIRDIPHFPTSNVENLVALARKLNERIPLYGDMFDRQIELLRHHGLKNEMLIEGLLAQRDATIEHAAEHAEEFGEEYPFMLVPPFGACLVFDCPDVCSARNAHSILPPYIIFGVKLNDCPAGYEHEFQMQAISDHRGLTLDELVCIAVYTDVLLWHPEMTFRGILTNFHKSSMDNCERPVLGRSGVGFTFKANPNNTTCTPTIKQRIKFA